MTLYEYLKANKILQKTFYKTLSISKTHMNRLTQRQVSPSINLALAILHYTDGAVSLRELMRLPEKKLKRESQKKRVVAEKTVP